MVFWLKPSHVVYVVWKDIKKIFIRIIIYGDIHTFSAYIAI